MKDEKTSHFRQICFVKSDDFIPLLARSTLVMFETVLNFCQITEVPTDMDVKVRYPPTTETGILRTKVEPTTTKTTGTVTQIVEDIPPPKP